MSRDNRSVFGMDFTHPEDTGVIAVSLGFQKCGTTMISDMLKHHPDVLRVGAKELHYLAGPEAMFHCNKAGAPVSLAAFYEDCFKGESPKRGQAVLDFTPTYGTMEFLDGFMGTVQSLRESGAQLRFIAVLRDPASRAVSSMGMKRKNNEGNYGNMTNEQLDNQLYHRLTLRQGGGASRFITDGEYADSLEAWFKTYEKESLLILNNPALNDVVTWHRVYQHLGLATPTDDEILRMLTDTNDVYNAAQSLKYEMANTEVYEAAPWLMKKLKEHYKPYNDRLWKLLGTDPWWSSDE